MLKNYLKIAFRNLIKHKIYSMVNIVGLAIGLACFILIMVWVQHEVSYDRFHHNADELYRVVLKTPTFAAPVISPPIAPTVQEELPEVVNTARVLKMNTKVFQVGNHTFYEDGGIIADSSLFSLFTFPFVRGNPQEALLNPGNIVITEEMAQKYFGDENPMNRVMQIKDGGPVTVSGVIRKIPGNSHLQFDYILPFQVVQLIGMDVENWGNHFVNSYLHLQPGANRIEIAEKITALYHQHVDDEIEIALQPLTDIHLTAGLQYDNAVLGDSKYVWIFLFVAFIVLFIACINFVNLTTASSATRFKEVGLRKSIGASQTQLTSQFLLESTAVIFFAVMLSLVFVELALPWFNQISGKSLAIHYLDPEFLGRLLTITVLTVLMAAFYPATHLSSSNPVKGLKKYLHAGDEISLNLRKILVITQFSLSIGLIIGTLVMSNQVSFMKNTSFGFDRENLVYLTIRGNVAKVYPSFKQTLEQNSDIAAVTATDMLPTVNGNATSWVDWEGKEDQQIKLNYNAVDPDYISTMGMELSDGRDFSEERTSDARNAFILNEEAVEQMGLESPVGKWLTVQNRRGEIIGIVKNAQFRSLQYQVDPQVYRLMTDLEEENIGDLGAVFIRISGNHPSETLAGIESLWMEVNPEIPFEFHFLDQTIDNLYRAESRRQAIFSSFMILAIVISSLGLFGMSTFQAQQRTKEIGIRKVLGATVAEIVAMLSKDVSRWVLLANVIAWPIAWYVMNRWLQNFAYRVDLSIWPFVLAGCMALAIAMLTVSWQAIRAATANPVDSLRSE